MINHYFILVETWFKIQTIYFAMITKQVCRTCINHAPWHQCLCSLHVGGNWRTRRKPTCPTWWPHDHLTCCVSRSPAAVWHYWKIEPMLQQWGASALPCIIELISFSVCCQLQASNFILFFWVLTILNEGAYLTFKSIFHNAFNLF